MNKISYMLEAAALFVAFTLFRIIGADNASALGGWIGRTLGPKLAASRKAQSNLAKSFPNMMPNDQAHVIRGMWDNLGRVIAEYPHLKTIIHNKVVIEGEEHLERIGRDNSFILFSGHVANWEIIPLYMNHLTPFKLVGVYREPNNPYAASLLDRCRNFEGTGNYLRKSSQGTRALVRVLRDKGRIGILIDQKYNQGIPVEFFGRPAMTSTAVSQLAIRFKVPVLPGRVVREQGDRFRITFYPPLITDGKDDATIMLEANRMLEGWVKDHPDQWLWLHRRWDSKALKELP